MEYTPSSYFLFPSQTLQLPNATQKPTCSFHSHGYSISLSLSQSTTIGTGKIFCSKFPFSIDFMEQPWWLGQSISRCLFWETSPLIWTTIGHRSKHPFRKNKLPFCLFVKKLTGLVHKHNHFPLESPSTEMRWNSTNPFHSQRQLKLIRFFLFLLFWFSPRLQSHQLFRLSLLLSSLSRGAHHFLQLVHQPTWRRIPASRHQSYAEKSRFFGRAICFSRRFSASLPSKCLESFWANRMAQSKIRFFWGFCDGLSIAHVYVYEIFIYLAILFLFRRSGWHQNLYKYGKMRFQQLHFYWLLAELAWKFQQMDHPLSLSAFRRRSLSRFYDLAHFSVYRSLAWAQRYLGRLGPCKLLLFLSRNLDFERVSQKESKVSDLILFFVFIFFLLLQNSISLTGRNGGGIIL